MAHTRVLEGARAAREELGTDVEVDQAVTYAVHRCRAPGVQNDRAPCCHKQVRKSMKTEGLLCEITKFGIMKERQAEMLTDTIRALILEAYGYKTRVFEFIATSHTPKNILIVGVKLRELVAPDQEVMAKIQEIKRMFGITYHELEQLLK